MNLKKLKEALEAKKNERRALLQLAVTETRALTEEENVKQEGLRTEIESIENTIRTIENSIEEEIRETEEIKDGKEKRTEKEEKETRDFEAYIRAEMENRAENNMEKGSNGAIVPTTIANKIIKKVYEISPIVEMATKFTTKGNLSFPVYDETTSAIIVGYKDEFQKLTASSGKFTSIELKGYLSGALAKISLSLINNTEVDLIGFVINAMAEAVARFFETELIKGTEGRMSGACSSKNIVTSAASSAITADELIDLQMEIHTSYVKNAIWTMSKNTLKAIKKLKNGDGEYILNKSLVEGFKWDILGNPVHITDNIDEMEAGKKPIIFGDMSGLYLKYSEAMNITVVREKYLDEHAVGIIAWQEADSKIVEPQKIAVLQMKA